MHKVMERDAGVVGPEDVAREKRDVVRVPVMCGHDRR